MRAFIGCRRHAPILRNNSRQSLQIRFILNINQNKLFTDDPGFKKPSHTIQLSIRGIPTAYDRHSVSIPDIVLEK